MRDDPPRNALAEQVTSMVRSSVGGPAVVLGSLPPAGRDLDLLVRRSEHDRLAQALPDRGLVRKDSTFAWFAACSAYAVELISAEEYLGEDLLDDLFASATPLPGLEPLAQPAPPHALLILARLVAEEDGMTAKRRARLERILTADPLAWGKAAEAAAGWGATDALARLQPERGSAGAHPVPVGRLARAARGRTRARLSGQRRPLVSFSGIDGSGKSSQARWLTDALTELGVDAELIWNDLLGNFALNLVGKPLKLLLRLAGREPEPLAQYEETPAGPPTDPGSGRRGAVRGVWSTFVTLSNALEQRVLAGRSRVRNEVVVFDRGPLDLAVRMEVLYRSDAERLRRLVERAAPRPDLAFFLEIPPELSPGRKDDVWSLGQLREHAALYDRLAGRFGARRLDGQRPPEELAAEIAQEVWLRAP
jgi:thymidylate kinase